MGLEERYTDLSTGGTEPLPIDELRQRVIDGHIKSAREALRLDIELSSRLGGVAVVGSAEDVASPNP